MHSFLFVVSLMLWPSHRLIATVAAFGGVQIPTTSKIATTTTTTTTTGTRNEDLDETTVHSRRHVLQTMITMGSAVLVGPSWVPPAHADGTTKTFAPGGTLVDYQVGVTVGNPQASPSRKSDNSNVIFSQDYYYKFGTAAPWIDPGSTDFPKTMPFTPNQQRYDALKKYRERVQRGIDLIANLGEIIAKGDYTTIPDSTAPEYSIRPMGLLANNFLASENTGTTNELLLARWYINEINLDIDDIKNASSKDQALKAHRAALNALNSLLAMLNRVITPKVGDKFNLVLD